MPQLSVPGTASTAQLDAHLAVPPVGDGPWPGVVVLHEIFGLNDDIRQQADRLAAAGYLAVAPDLYAAGGALRCLKGTLQALTRGHGPAVDDITAVRTWLAGRSDCTGRVGVIGFCMGGGFALLLSPRGFAAAASNYGVLPKDAKTALAGACPIVGSYGGRDRMIPGSAGKLEDTLTELGVEHDVKEYPEAGHSFLNRHSAGPFSVLERIAGLSYHEPSAEDAWGRVLRFFDQHLQGQG